MEDQFTVASNPGAHRRQFRAPEGSALLRLHWVILGRPDGDLEPDDLLFRENTKGKQELMRIRPERLDYRWLLGFGLDTAIPNNNASSSWSQHAFASLFVPTPQQFAEAGLVDVTVLHLDCNLIEAHTNRDSMIEGLTQTHRDAQ